MITTLIAFLAAIIFYAIIAIYWMQRQRQPKLRPVPIKKQYRRHTPHSQ